MITVLLITCAVGVYQAVSPPPLKKGLGMRLSYTHISHLEILLKLIIMLCSISLALFLLAVALCDCVIIYYRTLQAYSILTSYVIHL